MIRKPESRLKNVVLLFITLGIILPGSYGFISKFIEFIRTLTTVEGGGFTVVPIMNYLLVAAGFLCLLFWATANGMFRDVEGPKYTMLEREQMLDELEDHRERA